MAVAPSTASFAKAPDLVQLRFGHVVAGAGHEAGWSLEWTLMRHGVLAPRRAGWGLAGLLLLVAALASGHVVTAQMLPVVAGVSLALGLWWRVRHAGDRDRIVLRPQGLVVERSCGKRLERVEFLPEWVRVEPVAGEQSLIELSGQGRCITVGRLVRPELRRQLAQELRLALRRTRWPEAALSSALV